MSFLISEKRRRAFARFLILWLPLFVLPTSLAAKNGTARKIEKALQEKLHGLRNQYAFPGATVGFVLPDGKQGTAAVGYSDVEKRVRMNSTDRMPAGSVGKTFVSAILLSLAAEGKVNLDDKIEEWFKKESWFERLPNGPEITIRLLLNHRSGLKDHALDTQEFARDAIALMAHNPEGTLPPEKLVSYVLGYPPLFPPGEGYHYSDTNYILVGLIIEKVTGSAYYDELDKRILKKYKLKDTRPAVGRRLSGVIPGYIDPKNPFGITSIRSMENGLLLLNPQLEWTGGGLISTALDLARWAKLLYEGKVLPQRSMKEILNVGRFSYGLGVMVAQTDLGPLYGHLGYYPGYNTIMAYFPSQKFSLAVQFNRDYGHGSSKEVTTLLAEAVAKGMRD